MAAAVLLLSATRHHYIYLISNDFIEHPKLPSRGPAGKDHSPILHPAKMPASPSGARCRAPQSRLHDVMQHCDNDPPVSRRKRRDAVNIWESKLAEFHLDAPQAD